MLVTLLSRGRVHADEVCHRPLQGRAALVAGPGSRLSQLPPEIHTVLGPPHGYDPRLSDKVGAAELTWLVTRARRYPASSA
jgi:hypothetical protein